MTEQAKPVEAKVESEDTRTPMERAIANGYQEPEPPSREDRAKALIAHMEHAAKHNAPIGHVMLAEMRDLLGVKDEPEVDGEPA